MQELAASQVRCATEGTAALVLPGGGARSAYQVGVLRAIVERVTGARNPFPVICGVSAGAVNAASLACHADEFDRGVQRLESFWSTMHCARIYRTDALAVLRSALQWMLALPLGGRLVPHPKSLLDNSPLQRFLESVLRLDRIGEVVASGALRSVAVTASGYTCAGAVTFYQGGAAVQPWLRARREGRAAELTVPHLLASAALPLIFPAVQIGNEYFGDGGMRMISPLSPAIHLGADRLLVIATRDEHPDPPPRQPAPYPSLGEIGGYLLDTVFMDTLQADLQRLERINRALELIPPERRSASGLRMVESLVIRPSRDLRGLTREHVADIPKAVRLLLRSLGGWGRDWRLASYLLFEAPYCRELMELGFRDGCAMERELRSFLAPAAVRAHAK